MEAETEYRESFPPVCLMADIKYRVALLYTLCNRRKISRSLRFQSIFAIIISADAHEIGEEKKKIIWRESLGEECLNHGRVFSLRIILRKKIISVAYPNKGIKCGESDINPFNVRYRDSNPSKCYGKSADRELSSVTFGTIIIRVSTRDITGIPDYCDIGIKLTDDYRARNKLDIPRLVNGTIRVL